MGGPSPIPKGPMALMFASQLLPTVNLLIIVPTAAIYAEELHTDASFAGLLIGSTAIVAMAVIP